MLRILLVSGIFLLGFFAFSDWPVTHGPGKIAPHAPTQTPPPEGVMFMHENYLIQPLATFEAEARVLSRKRYYIDREADLAPFDLALGWGQMSDEQILSSFKISQSSRWYWWRADPLPLAKQEVIRSSANMHMIPADDHVWRQIKRVRKGSLIRLKGYLIEARGDDGWTWRSSLSREDSGNKACEVVYVQDFEVIESPS